MRASIYCSPDGDNFWLSINNMAAKAVQRDAYIGEKRRQVRDGKLYTVFPNTIAYVCSVYILAGRLA